MRRYDGFPRKQRVYPPAVAKRRQELLRGRQIRDVAQRVGVHDSQIVRLLNGGKSNPSYKLVRNLAAELGYRWTDEFWDLLEGLWDTMEKQAKHSRAA